MKLSDLKSVIRDCWTAATSYDPAGWSRSNPAWGQCAITALIIQDNFGGDLVYAEAEMPDGTRIPHYFSRVGLDKAEVDLTRDQFPRGTRMHLPQSPGDQYLATREYVLSFQSTQQRYNALRSSVSEALCELVTGH